MKEIDWQSTDDPPEKFGWYVGAILPRNHVNLDLERVNSWRESFGFTHVWYNNGNWWEPDHYGSRSVRVNRRLTHWAHLPNVPEILEVTSGRPSHRYRAQYEQYFGNEDYLIDAVSELESAIHQIVDIDREGSLTEADLQMVRAALRITRCVEPCPTAEKILNSLQIIISEHEGY